MLAEGTITARIHSIIHLGQYGRMRGYLASFPDAGAAATDMRRRFKFLGDTGVWRLLTSASRDIG